MKKSVEELQKMLKAGEYQEALNLIEENLAEKFDLTKVDDESKFSELLKLRIAAKTMLGQQDQIILDLVWKEKYPSGNSFALESGHKVSLVYKSIFDINTDAYVNTIHSSKLFDDYYDRSSTAGIINRIGMQEIDKQTSKIKNKMKGEYLILNHPKLSAPMSYHILFYEDDIVDLEALSKGIQRVLDDSTKRGLKKINFFPLGFDLVSKAKNEEKGNIAEELANKIAETITYYISENRYKNIPEVYFNFVVVDTMMTFDRAFYRWSQFNRNQFRALKHLSERERHFIDQAATKNPDYINSLKEIYYAFDDQSPILILGETGSGKSYLAGLIHEQSIRASKKLVKINCAMIKPGTINQILFGWKKGSYTDAKEDGVGAIESAKDGTLFLDEIGYADPEVQRMLLKFIEDGKYSRFGEQNIERESDVRLIFGTNINIEENVNQGLFQQDLYERISKYVINIPALRTRPGDIPLLLERFIDQLNKINKLGLEISDDAIKTLQKFTWPGNIRQLQFYIEKLYNHCRYNKVSLITDQLIKKDPPRNTMFNYKDPFAELESALKKILKTKDMLSFKIQEDVIQPMLAKIYIDDLDGIRKLSSKYIGLDGTRGEDSTLMKKYLQYKNLKELITK